MIRVSKGGSQLSGCQIAQNRDSFCDFGKKFESHLLTPESSYKILLKFLYNRFCYKFNIFRTSCLLFYVQLFSIFFTLLPEK